MSEILKDLARDLAINQVKISLLKNEYDDYSCLDEILDTDIDSNELPTRNIFVIGAGCSKSAYPKILPLGNESVDLLEKYFKREKWQPKMKEKAEEIEFKVNLTTIDSLQDFETKLYVLSHFIKSSEIRKSIDYLFSYKTLPNLFYELIAHLLKNRFIEGVINFNFDELLDQAIDEEVGQGQLHRVLSDGDCIPYEEMLTNERFKIPIYIKPHGTVSHKSSLRFTKEQYIDIPDDIETLLEEVLTGRSVNIKESNEYKSQFRDLNLIIAGFQMESIEFNKLLRRSMAYLTKNNRNVNIIYLNHKISKKHIVEENLKRLFHSSKDIDKNRVKIKVENLDHTLVDSYGISDYLNIRPLDKFILSLIHKIDGYFKPIYSPKEIFRHLGLVSFFKREIENLGRIDLLSKFPENTDLFLKEKANLFFNTKTYFLERTIFEVIIVVLKNKGIIQPKESLKRDNRIGHYFNLYVEQHRREYTDPKTATFYELSFYNVLDFLCLESNIAPDVKEIYSLNIEQNTYEKLDFIKFMNTWIKKIQNRTNIRDDHRKYVEVCINSLKKFKRVFSDIKSKGKKLGGDSIISSSSIHLYPNYKDIQLNIISKIHSSNIIPTNLALKYRFRSLLTNNQKSWERLHIVSDKGLILLSFLREIASSGFTFHKLRTIYLILSNPMAADIIEKAVDSIENLEVKIFNLPYYDHNRHMILFDSEDIDFTRIIYYYKKGFSNNVNAVYLEGKTNIHNTNMMFQVFKKYIAKSIYFDNNNGNIDAIPHFKSVDAINTIIKEYESGLNESDIEHFITFKKIGINTQPPELINRPNVTLKNK